MARYWPIAVAALSLLVWFGVLLVWLGIGAIIGVI